jgi:thiosulfate dehydrogenase [quinone] large subunit
VWINSGLGKVGSPVWTGNQRGVAVSGFLEGALAQATGELPAVLGWYADFIRVVAMPNATLFSYLVVYGELLAGLALLLGALTTFAALVSAFMNLNFMLAGVAGINPVMYTAAIFIIVGGASAGYYGLDYFLLPRLRPYWHKIVGRAKREG